MILLLPVATAAMAGALAVPSRGRCIPPAPRRAQQPDDRGWLLRGRWCWSVLACVGAVVFVTGRLAVPAGAAAAAVVWVWAGRAEPASVRRRRAALARELPAFVQLLAVALESGCDVAAAIRIVSGAMPGPAARLVVAVSQRLSLGVAPAEAWRPVLEHAELAPLGRAMVRAHRSGTSVTAALGVLADELESRTRQGVEERARSVGVKAALPLGLCLLPSFLLIGIVPMTVSLLRSLSLW